MGFSAQNRSALHCCRRRGSLCEGSGEGLEGFGAEPGQVQQGSREGSGEGLKVWGEALVQSQVRLNRLPEKVPEVKFNRVPEKVSVNVWEALVQSQVRCNRVPKKVPRGFGRFNRVPEKVLEKVWEALVQIRLRFSSAWLRSTLQKDL